MSETNGQTMAQQILARAAGRSRVEVGEVITARVDLAQANDVTGPLAVRQLQAAGVDRVFDPSRICIVAGRHAPFRDAPFAQQVGDLGRWCEQQGIERFFGFGEGMDHALIPELGYVRPGMLICNADSHACTLGVLGCFSTAVGSTDIAYVFAFGETWLKVPDTVRVVFDGTPRPWVTSKDLVLAALRILGVDGARYMSIEFTGSALAHLSVDERYTIANMAIEMGGKTGIMETDDAVVDYLAARGVHDVQRMRADPEAKVARTVVIDVDELAPQVAKPHSPANVVPVSEIRGTRVTQVTIGTCTNGHLVDLEQAASVLKGKTIAKGMRLIVTPATDIVYRQAMASGALATIVEAGGIVNSAGCGPCSGWHQGAVADDAVVMTTHNRNFRGRMGGKDAQVFLASPYVAAATALAGVIVDPSEVA